MSQAWAERHGLASNWEMQQVIAEVRAAFEPRGLGEPHTILEIGTFQGDSLRLWRREFNPALLIGIQDTDETTPEVAAEVGAQMFIGKSQEGGVFHDVVEALGGRPIDFLFIDGDHTYDAVLMDWDMYMPYVRRPGGIAVLHDAVIEDNPTVKVHRLYRELRAYHLTKLIYGGDNLTGSAVFYL